MERARTAGRQQRGLAPAPLRVGREPRPSRLSGSRSRLPAAGKWFFPQPDGPTTATNSFGPRFQPHVEEVAKFAELLLQFLPEQFVANGRCQGWILAGG